MEGERRPHFFKVLVGDFARRLEIPRDFLGHIPEMKGRTSDTSAASSAKVTLKHLDRKTSIVQLDKVDGRVFLTTGWPEFVEDNSLREYEFLLFRHDKDMHFTVLIFGTNACERTIQSSGSGTQETDNVEGKHPCITFPHSSDKLTETSSSLTHSHSHVEIVALQRCAQGDKHISSPSFPDIHEAGGSKDELETCQSLKGPMENDKAKAIAEVMRILHVDEVTVDLFCATLSLYKWNVAVAAEDFDVCRGKPQTRSEFLKQKLVLQFDFVKGQLRRFFPPDDDGFPPIPESRNGCFEEHNLSNQPLQCYQARVKRRSVDAYEPRDLRQEQKRRIVRSRRGTSWTPQTPRRSPRLAHQNNSRDSTDNVLKQGVEVIESSPTSTIHQAEDKTLQACVLYDITDNVLVGSHMQTIGFVSQEGLKLACGGKDLSEGPKHNQGESEEKIYQSNTKEASEQREINGTETSELFMGRGCIESLPTPPNSKVASPSIINELYFTWKTSEHANPIEKILLDIQRDNFKKTISHVQGIIRNHPSDLLTAAVIEAILQKKILQESCLVVMDAQKIVNALLEHAKKIKKMHNFNMETRKEEFSAKLHDQLKWQINELESACTSLELDYKKATSDANIAVSALQKQKKKLKSLQDDIKGLQQCLMAKEDEMQKLEHQVAEHQNVVQKSIMERVRVKTVLKSYEHTLDEAKERLTSTGLGLIDAEALVKVERDNMNMEIELSMGSLLNINFK